MKSRLGVWWWSIGWCAGLALTTACQQPDVGGASGEPDHAEVPAHKPLHFAASVDEIRRVLFAEQTTGADVAMLRDLFAWLPEMAAESDLGEGAWLTLRDQAVQGQRWVATIEARTARDQGAGGALTAEERAGLQDVYEALQSWCQYTSLREPIFDGRHAP